MLERVVQLVMGWDAQRVAGLLLQDMALCQGWFESFSGSPAEQTPYRTVPERIALWQSERIPPDNETEGRRHQVLLRDLMALLEEDRDQELNADEVAFLCAAHDIVAGAADTAAFDRVRDVLDEHHRILLQLRQEGGPAPGLPALSRRIQYVSEENILAAPSRTTRLLAGIELPCRGPVLTCPSHLRILGDVPDNCTVVIDANAYCCVDGYLLGRVLSKQHCEVRGNISGVAVTLHGDVRARSIINNAQVVAKMGSVFTRNAQGPKLIFAGKKIEIAEGTMLGKFVARVMHVRNDVRGGLIQVSDLVEADQFRHLGNNTLAIVLRRELSCEDFGEVTGADLNKLLSQAYRLRRVAHNFDAMAEIAEHEVEHTAQSLLMFLFGGTETHKKLEEVVAAQRHLDLLTRVMSNLREVLESAQDGLVYRSAEGAALSDKELLRLDGEGPVDQTLVREHEDAMKLRSRLGTKNLDRDQTSLILRQAQEKLERLLEERQKITATVAKKEREMQSLVQYEQILAGAAKSATKFELLQRILPALKKQAPDSPVAQRLKTRFVLMALKTIERRTRYIKECQDQAEQSRKDFRAVSERLGKDFQIRVLEQPEDEDSAARATGRFEPGVRIYMDVLIGGDEERGDDSVLVTSADATDAVKTYIRAHAGTRFHIKS